MDWLGRAMGLPRSMLYNPDGSTDHDVRLTTREKKRREKEIIDKEWRRKQQSDRESCSNKRFHNAQAQVKSKGGGVIQGTASEAVLVCMLAARTKACQRIHAETHEDTAVIMTRLIAYFSCQTHSSVEKAAMV